jgi:hypothetical protein
MRTGLELERRPTVWTRRARIEKGVNLLLEEVALEGEGVWTRPGSTSRCSMHWCFLLRVMTSVTVSSSPSIVTNDELQFDTHRGASPGSSGRGRK